MLILGTGGIKEDEDVVQTAVSALEFLHTVSQELDAVNSLVVRDVHQSWHELDGLEVSH